MGSDLSPSHCRVETLCHVAWKICPKGLFPLSTANWSLAHIVLTADWGGGRNMIAKFFGGDVVTVLEGTTIQNVAKLMDERSVGLIVVTERYSEGKPIGVITDRDIVIRAVSLNLNTNTEKVELIMSKDLVTVDQTSSIEDSIKKMELHRTRRLLVLDASGKISCVVSIDDLVELLGNEIHRLGNLCRSQVGTSIRHRAHDYTKMA